MKSIILVISVFLSSLLLAFVPHTERESGYWIAKKMFEKNSQISTLTYTMTKEERIDGKMIKQVSLTKMTKDPFQVYVKQLFPKEGVEILFKKGESKALINPNGFPWVNLKLSPKEGIMRNDQHHTIFHSGFDHVVSILEFLCDKYHSEIDEVITFEGMVTFEGVECYAISMSNPHFKYIDYTIKKGEDIEDIADRKKLSAYMILDLNRSVKDYDDVEAGQVIKIPNDYSPKMLLYVNKSTWTPVLMEVYDPKGLYERYAYSDVKINPKYSAEEFSSEYSEYGF